MSPSEGLDNFNTKNITKKLFINIFNWVNIKRHFELDFINVEKKNLRIKAAVNIMSDDHLKITDQLKANLKMDHLERKKPRRTKALKPLNKSR